MPYVLHGIYTVPVENMSVFRCLRRLVAAGEMVKVKVDGVIKGRVMSCGITDDEVVLKGIRDEWDIVEDITKQRVTMEIRFLMDEKYDPARILFIEPQLLFVGDKDIKIPLLTHFNLLMAPAGC